jgi:putative DNA primase/helicase
VSIAEAIAEKLSGKRAGSGFVCVCPAHDDHSPSLSIKDGDDGGLIVHCFVGCRPASIYAALRRVGVLNNTTTSVAIERPAPSKGSAEHQRQRQELAAWLWTKRRPVTGSPVEKYLRKRGYAGPIPATIGYLPASHKHPAAMISAFGTVLEVEPGVIGVPKEVAGVHLTKLTEAGTKITVENAKVMIGSCQGKPITISAPNDLLGMGVTEGVEDGLNVYQATGLGVWAAGSAGFMPALAKLIPPYIEVVTIFAHDDQGKPINAGRNNAIDLARKLKARNFRVLIEGL